MKKSYIILICLGGLFIGLIVLAGILLYFRQPCGGVMGIQCQAGYECIKAPSNPTDIITDTFGYCVHKQTDNNSETDTEINSNQSDELIEYNDSFGPVCPLGIKLLGSKSAPVINCKCPDDYTMSSNIVGFSTGEECYGSGTECPIMSSECVINAE